MLNSTKDAQFCDKYLNLLETLYLDYKNPNKDVGIFNEAYGCLRNMIYLISENKDLMNKLENINLDTKSRFAYWEKDFYYS